MYNFHDETIRAFGRIAAHIRKTPLEHSAYFSQLCACDVFWKCENLQLTKSFKVRGAFNKLLALTKDQQQRGIIAASSGNHGLAVAYGLKRFNIKGTIYVPETVSSSKLAAIKAYVSDVVLHGEDCEQTESAAMEEAASNDKTYISPYNDVDVIMGQATIGYELKTQLQNVDSVILSVGGGGLASGVAGYLKTISPSIEIIGCVPENSPVMAKSLAAGKIINCDNKDTLSDGTAGNLIADAITLDICKQYIDEMVLVSEQEIIDAMREFITHERMLIEGAAGVAVATLLKLKDKLSNKKVAVILCGANISLSNLTKILDK